MHLREIVDRLELAPDSLRLHSGKNISMPGELWGRLDAVAEALDCSRSALMRLIVESALEDLERELAQQVAEDDDIEEQAGVRPNESRRRGKREAAGYMEVV